MAVTIAIDTDRVERTSRNLSMVTGSVTFDTSYPTGGEVCTDISKLFGGGEFVVIFENKGGYTFEWDKVNNKVKAFTNAPPIVFEEAFDADSDLVTLKYPVAHIDYVATEAAPIIPIFGGLVPAASQVAVDCGYDVSTGVLTKGEPCTLTFYAAEGSVTTYCSYATQAWKDLTDNMSSALMTEGAEVWGDGLTFTAGTPDVVKLGVDICAMTSITWNDNGTYKTPELLKDGGAPAATLETEIDFVKSGQAEVNTYATDAVDAATSSVYYQYIKLPATGFLKERFTNAAIDDA